MRYAASVCAWIIAISCFVHIALGCTVVGGPIACNISASVQLAPAQFNLVNVSNVHLFSTIMVSLQFWGKTLDDSLIVYYLDDDELDQFLTYGNISYTYRPTYTFTIQGENETFGLTPPTNDEDLLYIVFYNPSENSITVEYTVSYSVVDGWTGVIASFVVVTMMAGLPFLCVKCRCCFCRGLMDGMPYGPNNYPAHKPLSFGLSFPCLTKVSSLIPKPVHGFRIFYLNGHDLGWIWFPADQEMLNFPKRILITLTMFLFAFVFQCYCQPIILAKAKHFASGYVVIAIQYLVTDVVIRVIFLVARPVVRNIHYSKPKMILSSAEKPATRRCGMVLNWLLVVFVILVEVYIVLAIIYFGLDEGILYLIAIRFPFYFMYIVVWRALVFGLPIAVLMYIAYCVLGSDAPPFTSESTPLLGAPTFVIDPRNSSLVQQNHYQSPPSTSINQQQFFQHPNQQVLPQNIQYYQQQPPHLLPQNPQFNYPQNQPFNVQIQQNPQNFTNQYNQYQNQYHHQYQHQPQLYHQQQYQPQGPIQHLQPHYHQQQFPPQQGAVQNFQAPSTANAVPQNVTVSSNQHGVGFPQLSSEQNQVK